MGDGIFYNQSVTSADLNDIAIDLGHSSFNGFGAEKFGAAELNKITRDLVGKGYLKVGNMCKPSVSSSGALTVQDGIVVFSDGAKRDFTSSKTFSDDYRGWIVYFRHDTANGRVTIHRASSYPADGDYVPLCEVKADGTVIDKRVLAVAKVQLNAVEKNKTETVQSESFVISLAVSGTVVTTIPLSFNGYNIIRINSGAKDDGGYVELPTTGKSDSVLVSNYRAVKFERTATGLNVYGETYSRPDSGATFSLNITMF